MNILPFKNYLTLPPLIASGASAGTVHSCPNVLTADHPEDWLITVSALQRLLRFKFVSMKIRSWMRRCGGFMIA